MTKRYKIAEFFTLHAVFAVTQESTRLLLGHETWKLKLFSATSILTDERQHTCLFTFWKNICKGSPRLVLPGTKRSFCSDLCLIWKWIPRQVLQYYRVCGVCKERPAVICIALLYGFKSENLF